MDNTPFWSLVVKAVVNCERRRARWGFLPQGERVATDCLCKYQGTFGAPSPGTTATEEAEHFAVPVTAAETMEPLDGEAHSSGNQCKRKHDPGGDVVTTGVQDPTTDEQTQNHHRNGE